MFLADRRLGAKRLYALSDYDQVLPFETQGLVYEAISGHPDIFVCPLPGKVIVAANLPTSWVERLQRFTQKPVRQGALPVGDVYPASARYNIGFSKKVCVGGAQTDPVLKAAATAASEQWISVKQGYVRCNLLWVGSAFVTSDRGIEKALRAAHLDGLYIDPAAVLLPGFPNGFIGGCAGSDEKHIFWTGALKHLGREAENALRELIEQQGLETVELSQGPLIDGGGLIRV